MNTKTPLLTALNNRQFSEAKELLQAGETFPDDMQPFNRKNIFDTLLREKQFELIDRFAEQGAIETDVYEFDAFRNSFFESLFRYLPAEDADAIVWLNQFLKKFQNINDEVEGFSLLSYALEQNAHPAIIQSLIDAGCGPFYKNNAESNLVNIVCRLNVIKRDRGMLYLDLLIKAGVDVNEGNVEKKTALHEAILGDKKEYLPQLLENGAAPNEQDWQGNTPIFYALAYKQDKEMYEIMAAHQAADFYTVNKSGSTPLSEFMRMMQGSKRDIELLDKLLEDGADMEHAAPYYNVPKSGWKWALEKPIEVLQLLLEKTGRDINQQDDDGNTLLHILCSIDSNYEQSKAKETYKKVKLLLEKGADVSITNNKDETAQDLAMKDNLKTKTVELLLTAKK